MCRGLQAPTHSASTSSLRAQRSNPDCLCGKILDCFAEPVIGPRFARTRWLAMTEYEATQRPFQSTAS
ncbi:hypothetical protein CWO91_16410 [Bradyrhizobium genosp. SA-3]|nr:hypothetical protein CWO91_16410 [Bradyrhizobium genosp. SA-3]